MKSSSKSRKHIKNGKKSKKLLLMRGGSNGPSTSSQRFNSKGQLLNAGNEPIYGTVGEPIYGTVGKSKLPRTKNTHMHIGNLGFSNSNNGPTLGNLAEKLNKPNKVITITRKGAVKKTHSNLVQPTEVAKKLNKLSLKSLSLNSSSNSVMPTEITHMWFRAWPDQGVPENMDLFNEFINIIKEQIIEKKGETLIHCSAGVGRTGVVYIVLFLLFQDYQYDEYSQLADINSQLSKLNTGTNSNLLQSIKEQIQEFKNTKTKLENLENTIFDNIILAKKHRHPFTVQTIEQYNFICKYFGIKEPTKTYDFDKLKDTIIQEDIVGLDKCNNRYKNILPSNRVILEKSNNVNPCINYINASQMIPFTDKKNNTEYNIITASCPTPSTYQQFYKMLLKKNVKTIIMVTGIEEKSVKKCDPYFPVQPINPNWGITITDLKLDTSVPDNFKLIKIESKNSKNSKA